LFLSWAGVTNHLECGRFVSKPFPFVVCSFGYEFFWPPHLVSLCGVVVSIRANHSAAYIVGSYAVVRKNSGI
jgi:hypothetical protein